MIGCIVNPTAGLARRERRDDQPRNPNRSRSDADPPRAMPRRAAQRQRHLFAPHGLPPSMGRRSRLPHRSAVLSGVGKVIELDPCRFCAEDSCLVAMVDGSELGPDHYIFCGSCGARGPRSDRRDDAVKAWNLPRPKYADDNKIWALRHPDPAFEVCGLCEGEGRVFGDHVIDDPASYECEQCGGTGRMPDDIGLDPE